MRPAVMSGPEGILTGLRPVTLLDMGTAHVDHEHLGSRSAPARHRECGGSRDGLPLTTGPAGVSQAGADREGRDDAGPRELPRWADAVPRPRHRPRLRLRRGQHGRATRAGAPAAPECRTYEDYLGVRGTSAPATRSGSVMSRGSSRCWSTACRRTTSCWAAATSRSSHGCPRTRASGTTPTRSSGAFGSGTLRKVPDTCRNQERGDRLGISKPVVRGGGRPTRTRTVRSTEHARGHSRVLRPPRRHPAHG